MADAVVEMLRPIRERYLELRADEAELSAILADGASGRASQVADRRRSPRCSTPWAFGYPPRGG